MQQNDSLADRAGMLGGLGTHPAKLTISVEDLVLSAAVGKGKYSAAKLAKAFVEADPKVRAVSRAHS